MSDLDEGCHEIVVARGGDVGPCDRPVVGLACDGNETYPACPEHALMIEAEIAWCVEHYDAIEPDTEHCADMYRSGHPETPCRRVPLYLRTVDQ